jgi:hypothetical protein
MTLLGGRRLGHAQDESSKSQPNGGWQPPKYHLPNRGLAKRRRLPVS